MLDIGLVSIWSGLLLLSKSPSGALSGLVKGIVFFLLWIGAWYSISLAFSSMFASYMPYKDHVMLVEQLVNLSFSVAAFAVAWLLAGFGFRNMASSKPRAIPMWLAHLILWKVLIFNPVYSQKTPQFLLLTVTLALAVLYTIAQTRRVPK